MYLQKLAILLMLGVISFPSIGQTSKKYEKFASNINYTKGQVVTVKGETIDGVIKVFLDLRVYSKVVMVTKDGKKHVYYPSSLKEYQVGSYRFISDGYFYFKEVFEGSNVGLYERQSVNGSQYGSFVSGDYFYKHLPDGELLRARRIYFQKDFKEFFLNCPDIQAKIESKEFKYKNIVEMFRYYQHSCKNKVAEEISSGK